MGIGYQRQDFEIVDYQLYKLKGTGLLMRGPEPTSLDNGGYFTAIGAAQTFGRFCEDPFPAKLQRTLELQGLNLGRAGAGPKDFLRHPPLLRYINGARFAIVQVLSGRSVSNSYFTNPGGGTVYRADGSGGTQPVLAADAYKELLANEDTQRVREVIRETRANWVTEMKALLEAITVPKLLFWFSVRAPRYKERYGNLQQLFGGFPQLVNHEMMAELLPLSDAYVECITSRGLPQALMSRWDGSPVPVYKHNRVPHHNLYYPSPQMQEDAAARLEPAARTFL